jgi:transcriptional regulator with XRE-family HTH domain
MTSTPTYYDLMRSIRTRSRQTQQQVADRLATVPSSISKWESGDAIPDAGKLAAYLIAVEASPAEQVAILHGLALQSAQRSGHDHT